MTLNFKIGFLLLIYFLCCYVFEDKSSLTFFWNKISRRCNLWSRFTWHFEIIFKIYFGWIIIFQISFFLKIMLCRCICIRGSSRLAATFFEETLSFFWFIPSIYTGMRTSPLKFPCIHRGCQRIYFMSIHFIWKLFLSTNIFWIYIYE